MTNNKLNLDQVTLLGLDCVDMQRLLRAFQICEGYADFAEKKLLTSIGAPSSQTSSGIQIIPIEQIDSKEKYSEFMVKRLADYVETPFVLVIQYDGFILNPAAWTDDFSSYDYIGAPWWYEDEYNVGNGGFSLRSKKLLDLLKEDPTITKTHPEDHVICRTYGKYLAECGIKFAPESLAARFSIEGKLHNLFIKAKYGNAWTNQFGFHGLRKTDISTWEGYKNLNTTS